MAKVIDAIRNRKSTISFSSRGVEKGIFESLFEAARWAPSSYNEQPWRFMFAHRGSEAYKNILKALVPGNNKWAGNAPFLIISLTNKYLAKTGKPNKYAWYDLGQAVSNLSTQATSVGLKLHQMGGFNPGQLREEFDISEDYEIASVIAVGYSGNLDDPDPVQKGTEISTRSRKPLDEIVFDLSPNKEAISIN